MPDKTIAEKDEIIKIIRTFLNDNFLFGDDRELEEETSFLECGIIDSTGILELVATFEEKFRILIEDDEIVPENLDSLKNIITFLQKKLRKV
jgi:acyl carrier protein